MSTEIICPAGWKTDNPTINKRPVTHIPTPPAQLKNVHNKHITKKIHPAESYTFFYKGLMSNLSLIFICIFSTITMHKNTLKIIIIIIIFIYCNWVVTKWQWLFYMYTKHEIGY